MVATRQNTLSALARTRLALAAQHGFLVWGDRYGATVREWTLACRAAQRPIIAVVLGRDFDTVTCSLAYTPQQFWPKPLRGQVLTLLETYALSWTQVHYGSDTRLCGVHKQQSDAAAAALCQLWTTAEQQYVEGAVPDQAHLAFTRRERRQADFQ